MTNMPRPAQLPIPDNEIMWESLAESLNCHSSVIHRAVVISTPEAGQPDVTRLMVVYRVFVLQTLLSLQPFRKKKSNSVVSMYASVIVVFSLPAVFSAHRLLSRPYPSFPNVTSWGASISFPSRSYATLLLFLLSADDILEALLENLISKYMTCFWDTWINI